ncbi:hypothetical protein [Synechococcus sp. GFB01]|jgi:hypothetical protein|uniref:hypothetical protein n=1 Tax=Synechococcus sp. GFB01 TaxID=1662190 RepID=UPI00064F1321|nr:hypothetical protein [Synechococcus sp. GFB01]KMM17872.1 hypothetical protein SYNGFB01_01290 [Synechococcus sp. GFB01]
MSTSDGLPLQNAAADEGFGRHQIWCDGEVLYRVESCTSCREHCRLVPLNGVSSAPLQRRWSNTAGLRRVR